LGRAAEGENGNNDNEERVSGVQGHDQIAAVCAVNEHPGEGKQDQRRECLQDQQGAQRHLRMRSLEQVPDHGGCAHPAANHGDEDGGKDQPQSAMLQKDAHVRSL